MGLRWSMENIGGWRSQFDRMARWHQRISCSSAGPNSDQDRLDFYLSFFQSCYALRDWLVESGVIAKDEMDPLIQTDRSMRLCRDVCNRSKHFRLRRTPSVDGDFSILREYQGENSPSSLAIIAGEEKRDLWDVAEGCFRFWHAFVQDRRIPNPPSPFARRNGEQPR